jgi:hypothetical protein
MGDSCPLFNAGKRVNLHLAYPLLTALSRTGRNILRDREWQTAEQLLPTLWGAEDLEFAGTGTD